jgi:hypothetical protein
MNKDKEIITTSETNYGGKICRCAVCGTEELCTFDFDFYPYEKDGQNLLRCERCLLFDKLGTAYPPIIKLYPDGRIEKDE